MVRVSSSMGGCGSSAGCCPVADSTGGAAAVAGDDVADGTDGVGEDGDDAGATFGRTLESTGVVGVAAAATFAAGRAAAIFFQSPILSKKCLQCSLTMGNKAARDFKSLGKGISSAFN